MKAKVNSFKIHSFKESCMLEKIIILSIVFVLLISISLCVTSVKPHAAESADLYKTYNSYLINEGDTLTDVARMFYSPTYYGSLQEAIKEVKTLNNLHGDHITAGCYLVIPEYLN